MKHANSSLIFVSMQEKSCLTPKLLLQRLLVTCIYWGTGLNVAKTLECLSDYWPKQNVMGKILMELQSEIQDMSQAEVYIS